MQVGVSPIKGRDLKISPFFVFPFLIFLALIPPINFYIMRPVGDWWFMMVLIMAFAGVYVLFIKTDWFVKVISIWTLIQCFLCGDPLTALTSYASIIIGLYLYILCTRIDDWSVIFKSFQTLLILNILVMAMQMIHRDNLLNFGLDEISTYGIIGQHMQMGSFATVLTAVLLPFSLGNLWFPFFVSVFCNSSWTFLTAGIGVFILCQSRYKTVARVFMVACGIFFIVFALKTGKFESNTMAENGRFNIWVQSIKWANHHPWVGWGAGSYKLLFPSFYLDIRHDIPYKNAHNWIVQMVFEMGYPFALFLIALVGNLMYQLWKAREIVCFVGLLMIVVDMEVHFPERMLQTVGIVICFLAYCRTRLGKRVL